MRPKGVFDALIGKEAAIWDRVTSLIATTRPKAYAESIALLIDLRDLAARGNQEDFWRRVTALRESHAGKPAFLGRLAKAGL